ncbi:MAG: hypothetical protein IJB41_06345 [Clostridia bacterium]|nr:hypothetical protein [Clostridia bacterium]
MKKFLMVFALALCVLLGSALAQSGPQYEVILPEGYEGGAARYPVAYVLPQQPGKADDSALGEDLSAGGMEWIIVRPVLNSADDLAAVIAQVDAQYRTVADAQHRALVGVDAGGYLAYAIGLSQDSPVQMLASVRGDFAGGAQLWQAGDVYAMAKKLGAKGFEQIYTYMDAPAGDALARMEGSTNDLGALLIEYHTGAEAHEFTLRPGAFDEQFIAESAARLADRLTARMLGGLATGTVSLESSTVGAQQESVVVQYSVALNETAAGYGEDTPAQIVLQVQDPATGEVLAETLVRTVSVMESAEGEAHVANIVNGESSNIVLMLKLLGGEVELASASLIRAQDAIIDGDVQKIELAGDWYFRYTGMQAINPATLTAEEFEQWHVVQPGLGNWAKDYGNINDSTVKTGFGGADFFNYMITGNGYYAKSVYVPQEFDSDDLILSIGYIDDRCEVYLNGVKVGSTGMTDAGEPNGQTTWAEYSKYDIDESLLVRGGENVIVVRAWNDQPYGAGGWYAGPIGLYSRAALEGGSSAEEGLVEKTFVSEYAGKASNADGPIENQYLIYLPEGYETSGKRYPTVYLLHQFNSDHTSYRSDKVDQLLDEGAAAGLFDEMIVVIPNSDGNSWWAGDWEKMVVEELVPLIDSEYRTIPDARYRLTAGCSMGGQGAYSVALHNPDVFSGAVSFYGAFSYGGKNSPNAIAAAESAEYMDYFSMAFICGNQDSYGFGVPAIELHEQLLALGVEHYFLIDNGGHDSSFYVPFFDECFGYVRGDMYAADAAIGDLIHGSISADGKAQWTADEGILAYCNVVPASSYLPETVQDLNVVFVLQAVQGDEIVFEAEAGAAIAQGALSGEIEFDLSGADLTGCELVLKAHVLDCTVTLK